MGDELSGDALNRALAEVMGEPVRVDERMGYGRTLFWRGQGEQVPDFATSLDALRDGPEQLLREGKAWEIVAAWFRTSEGVEVFEATIHVIGSAAPFVGRGATEAEARARAALAALQSAAAKDGE